MLNWTLTNEWSCYIRSFTRERGTTLKLPSQKFDQFLPSQKKRVRPIFLQIGFSFTSQNPNYNLATHLIATLFAAVPMHIVHWHVEDRLWSHPIKSKNYSGPSSIAPHKRSHELDLEGWQTHRVILNCTDVR